MSVNILGFHLENADAKTIIIRVLLHLKKSKDVAPQRLQKSMNRINIVNAGLALGICLGLYLVIIGLASTWSAWGDSFVELMGSWYLGYTSTIGGSLIGGLWGFVDGFFGGVIVAAIYNFLQKK